MLRRADIFYLLSYLFWLLRWLRPYLDFKLLHFLFADWACKEWLAAFASILSFELFSFVVCSDFNWKFYLFLPAWRPSG